MNKDQIAGMWKQVRGEARKQWGELTEDDLDKVQGDFTALVGKIQERYGVERDEAERQVNEWRPRT